nr:uncharacterized protein CFP56_39667 [Quercus suber]
MDMEAESDKEVEEPRLGALQSKLNMLWKPVGSLDCVDLGKEFYSVRFLLKEDMDAVLKNGPWFIVGHFLSIRPWEPFFKPEYASVSSIVVWVRLHALPMELYEAEVLKQIGEAIGKVLRIDSHTTMEARGRYARLCIQLDITKPLINIVLIGRFEQLAVYEGIHRLCFSYGRIWHRLEACPLTIKKPEMPTKGGLIGCGVEKNTNQGAYQRGTHDSYSTSTGSGMSKDRIVSTGDDGYDPWMLVALRKPGQKKTNLTANTKDHTGHGLGQSMHGLKQEPKRVIGANTSDEQSKPSGDTIRVKEASSSICVHPYNGVSALLEV